MDFVADKDADLIPFVLSQILDTSINGITLSDPDQEDNPIVYANAAFELITGYEREDIIGHNCRFLHGEDRDQVGLTKIREAIREHRDTTVTLRNYRKDGTLFYNRLSIRPLYDRQGKLIYFLGVQYDVTDQVQAREELERLKEMLRIADRETRSSER
ncbi:PAS sensor protein [Thiocapsa imhoffii]|uniref:PAS sensor protein n=1 Tax=Thiocapsa imhoffii TaxID=382777 RepID=A0A9X0WKE1_9GAMM|nr:PAS domain-containing protein [Thiocapsa imhoffii]MBK1646319.1 PAS sensor protein [Thiocapsa imhoffii]